MTIIHSAVAAAALILALGSVANAQAYDSDPNQPLTNTAINGAQSNDPQNGVVTGRSAFVASPFAPGAIFGERPVVGDAPSITPFPREISR